MNEKAKKYIEIVTAQVNGSSKLEAAAPNPVVNRFISMAREANYDPETGPSSEGVIYSAMDLLATEGFDREIVDTSYRVLKDKNVVAKMNRGFQTGAIVLSLINKHFQQR